ncbi:diaminopimelate decarboxylase [Bergeyella porcorum]|uniref:Diaminopimelate decarboxylase n=1 Tax=Bergeyella porcorum TaxID=1735111 RepID=A0AAU0F1I8_9FLAO
MKNQQLLDIANEFGTPVYVYDANSIQVQYEKLKTSFNDSTRFFYACKALTNINILKYIQQLGANLDCVSINEVKLGLKAGFTPERILFTPNCVDLAEIEEAMSFGVHINIDNISILEQFGNKYGNSYPIFIRINPHIYAGGNHKISTGHIDSKFGISIHQMRHIERIMKSTNLLVEGLHMHTGSEIKDADVFLQGLEIMFELSEQFPDLKYIDMGSGFKVPYQDGDMETDVKSLGKKVEKAFEGFKQESAKALELWFEPGKYLVSNQDIFGKSQCD